MARRRKSGRDIDGILLIDKRQGVSSNRALQEVRRLYNASKAGHSGSLDPLATGLLPVCFGEATKVSAFMLDDDKRYEAVIKLGVVTDSGDMDGSVTETHPVPDLSGKELESILAGFIGEIRQIPPMYSALKHEGRRLYELAREGKSVERKARVIQIYSLECLEYSGDQIRLDVRCSKGTYIRTLAEDIGRAIGCGATIAQLRRLEAGCFSINEAFTLDQLQELNDAALMTCLRPVDEPLMSWSAIHLHEPDSSFIKQGGQVRLSVDNGSSGKVRLYSDSGFIGIGEVLENGMLIPKRLFNCNGVVAKRCALEAQ